METQPVDVTALTPPLEPDVLVGNSPETTVSQKREAYQKVYKDDEGKTLELGKSGPGSVPGKAMVTNGIPKETEEKFTDEDGWAQEC